MIDEDHCVYFKSSGSKFVIMTLNVDDILIVGNNVEYLKNVKNWLSSNFEMKDMGNAVHILGVKISKDRSKRLFFLSQETYINKVLERFNMQNCKPIGNPIAKGETLSKRMCPQI